jgi:hypothetical protein
MNHDRTQRRVVCAAIRAADGDVLIGIRHYSKDMVEQINARSDGAKFKHLGDLDQGFVDKMGVFMSREEAYGVALYAGQIIYPDSDNQERLYSENLY